MKTLITTILLAAATQLYAETSVQMDVTPVEQKVVELHITIAEAPEAAESKYRKPKKENFTHHATCSGAFIDGMGDIITARHCTENAAIIDVVTYDRREYRAVFIATSAAHDLAIIHIDRTNTAYFEPAERVGRGQTVFVLGSPLGETDTLSTGIVAKLSGDVTLLDCSVLPGNSGGPAFDTDGRLIGITTAGYIVLYGTTHLNIAQGLDAVKFFVVEALAKRK